MQFTATDDLAWTPKIDYQRADDDRVAPDGLHVIKKTRARLEQFERKASDNVSASNKGDPTLELTQSEYIARIHKMEKELITAWDENRKVAALRIAIKCVKLLADTTTCPQLYPCVYVLVTDVLDCFGKLVFERIKTRASEDENGQPLPKPLSEAFTSADVNIHAKETCRNWFYKTACIRELLPRMYVEVSSCPQCSLGVLTCRFFIALSRSRCLSATAFSATTSTSKSLPGCPT